MSFKAAIHKLQKCIADVGVWNNNSTLRLDEAKTEFIIFIPVIIDVNNSKFILGTNFVLLVLFSDQVKILGVYFDSKMTHF